MLCQTPLASGAGKEGKKSISERRGELAAAQLRPLTFVKRKRANLVYPSRGCSAINCSLANRTLQPGRGGLKGQFFQPGNILMEEDGKALRNFPPCSSLDSAPVGPTLKVSAIMSQGRLAPRGVRGGAGRRVNGQPPLLHISHLI